MASSRVLFLIIVLSVHSHYLGEALEPITTGVAVGTAIVSSAIFASYDVVKCQLYECCDASWIQPNFTGIFSKSLTQTGW